jgi:hypothetical protein
MTIYKNCHAGAPQHASFPTAPSRVACLPEYFMYYLAFKAPGYEAVLINVIFKQQYNTLYRAFTRRSNTNMQIVIYDIV